MFNKRRLLIYYLLAMCLYYLYNTANKLSYINSHSIGINILNLVSNRQSLFIDTGGVKHVENNITKNNQVHEAIDMNMNMDFSEYNKVYIQREIHNNVSADSHKHEHVIKILFWTKSFLKHGLWFGDSVNSFAQCEYSNCMGTWDKGEAGTSDALLFHLGRMKYNTLPSGEGRPGHQKWILHTMECPERLALYTEGEANASMYNSIFNLTMTYHSAADIQYTYSHMYGRRLVKRQITNKQLAGKNYAAEKTKLVAWFVSNCGKWRMEFVKELRQYIPIDIYGKCGNLTCKETEVCNEMLAKDYKFYLSFESFLCEDYYTEKLWRPLLYDTVPIVMGATDYSKILPTNSFTDVKDFKSPKHLAEYLVKLDRDDDLYNQYLRWYSAYDLIPYQPMQCQLCEYLNKNRDKYGVHNDMENFWSNDRECFQAKDYYSGIHMS